MKKITLLLMFFALIISNKTNAQWEQRADPIFTKDHGIGFSLNGLGYILTGGANGQVFSSTKDFFQYDPIADTWSQLADYPGPARGYGIGDTWNGKLYFGFGQDDNGVMLNDLWEWDPVSNNFTQLPSCPCDVRVHPALVADNGKVYLGAGGGAAGNLADFWTYDITAQTWTQIANIPGNRHHPYQFSINGEVYVGAGHLNSWYKLDENTNSWIKLANLVPRVAGSQFSYDGKGYALSGGDKNHNSFSTGEFWEYDPLADTWTELPPHPSTSRFGSTQFVIDNYIYLLGGYYRKNGNVTAETTMYRYQLDQTKAPTGAAIQSFCDADAATVADLTATGTVITWYADATTMIAMSSTDALVNGSKYYATDTDGSESLARFEVTVTINNCSVGVEENPLSQITIFPNPTQKEVTISSAELIDVKLTDLNGKILLTQTQVSGDVKFDFSTYSKGLYFVNISNQNGTVTHKIIKE